MKNFISLFCLLFLLTSTSSVSYLLNYQEIFICNSQYGKKYHYTKSCRGLNACKAPIKKLSLEQAKKLGKSLCGWED